MASKELLRRAIPRRKIRRCHCAHFGNRFRDSGTPGVEGANIVISSRKIKSCNKAIEELSAKGLRNVCAISCHVGSTEDRQRLLDFVG
ncbi:hypothetical protein L596_012158 [Steinernema carpocapsae]|uniref:Uncharacterized protein n=1 Tax=Steinernema carpocapsae TaxID=34508 RepID=A0A4U5NW54_STECR|nr:hypothetical protein L596_012158 [Steinernema carpocapsae]